MRTPKIVEAKRCMRYETPRKWSCNPEVVQALTSVNRLFLFNADETEISRKVACKEGGSHVSLFLVVSATGDVMTPVVLHGPPHCYVRCEESLPQLLLYQTRSGYMEKGTFKDIMAQVFIPFVNRKRKKIDRTIALLKDKIEKGLADSYDTEQYDKFSSISKHAVLVADGHRSRYDPETLKMLRDADIDLVILPAHSSHLTQPLDLGLNRLIKQEFRKALSKPIPDFLRATLKQKPNKRAKLTKSASSGTEEKSVVKAEYDRLHVLYAIANAIPAALKPCNIISAWGTAHLAPFNQDPPYSEKDESDMCRELSVSALEVQLNGVQETDGATIGLVNKSITGVVNSSANLPSMTELLTQDLQPETWEGQCTVLVSDGPVTALLQSTNENDDVGDSVQIVPGANGNPAHLSGLSNARCFVLLDNKDL